MATDSGLIGRNGELARLRGLIDPPPAESQTLVVLGDQGMGKTVLLRESARQARSAGWRVLSVAGRESEQDLAFAGLHQLLLPVQAGVADLPSRQAKALQGAFGLSADPEPPGALLIGIAVLTLLSDLSEDCPLLVMADDAQWLDRGSLDALAFAARRVESEPMVLLLGVRGTLPPPGFERGFPELPLEPLNIQDAERLLDVQPDPPRGWARHQVLTQAAGNPMALIELSRVIAADPAAGRRWAAEPLPPTDRLTAVIAGQYGGLPRATQEALLLAAVADNPDLAGLALPGLTAAALAPAEKAGLIRVTGPGPQFTHPLIRSAVYHAVPFAERAGAHRKIAEVLRDQPDRYAWHLAAATLTPDENVASLLEETAAQARRRGGAAAAARALERAAELSPDDRERARRLLAAARRALAAGQADWVEDLATRVLVATTDPDLRIAARLQIGWVLTWSNRHVEALTALLAVAAEASARLPVLAWDAIGLAATAVYHCGTPAAGQALLHTLDRMAAPAQPPPGWPAAHIEAQQLWAAAVADPFARRNAAVPALHRLADAAVAEARAVSDVRALATAAWLLDETEFAIRLLRHELTRLDTPGVRGGSGPVLSALQWAYVDSGRWDEALATGREAADAAAAYKLDTVAISADLATATVLAMRGDELARPLLTSVSAAIESSQHRAAQAWAQRAAGIAALAEGSYLTAYAQLSQLFEADGAPLHNHVSYLGIADLAAAAVRAERHLEARTLVESALDRADPAPGPRLEQLAARARGLLAEPAEAEAHFRKALSDPGGGAWPFERAQLELDYGEWLRRQRRINDAKPVLGAALATFRGLGAAPWARRAEAELRACGVTTAPAADESGALADLTAQQREIVILASRGLTNSEIADRLFLSRRTVASHLYRSYPKLGIAGRHQLRDLVDRAAGQ